LAAQASELPPALPTPRLVATAAPSSGGDVNGKPLAARKNGFIACTSSGKSKEQPELKEEKRERARARFFLSHPLAHQIGALAAMAPHTADGYVIRSQAASMPP
jgi:hypothetical protein